MKDPFVGTWTLNCAASQFDANHRPSDGTMQLLAHPDGGYVMTAEGKDANGKPVTERRQIIIPDGRAYPVPDMPGLTTVTTRPDARTLRAEVKREDGTIAGEGSYRLSEDGASLTATTAGFDSQLRRFQMRSVWDRRHGGQ